MEFDWKVFARSLTAALERGPLSVTMFHAGPEPSPRHDLLIGVGTPDQKGPRTVILNNKGRPERYWSVARLTADFPFDLVEGWEAWPASGSVVPEEILPHLRLVVEDASPDSVLSVVYFLARLAGASASDLPKEWTAAAERWERSGDAFDPHRSWAPLCAALGHGHFIKSPASADDSDRRHLAEDELRDAWTRCLRLTVQAIAAGQNPGVLGEGDLDDLDEAQAAVAAEYSGYLMALAHARKTQLYLPMAGNSRRRLLVDALFFVEDDPAGAKKLFARRDRANAPLGQGFAFMAVYRGAQELVGSGNDVVISLDTRRNLVLDELWQALEDLESAKWGDARPCDRPRSDLRRPVAHGCAVNQPWYITPDGSLVAAPRAVTVDGRAVPGRRVEWAEAYALIWTLYNPARFVTVRQPFLSPDPQPLTECRPEEIHAKRLIWAEFDTAAGAEREPPTLILSQATHQVMAAMLRPSRPPGPVGLDELPPVAAFDVVVLAGGHAVVAAEGCFLFNDWDTPSLDQEGCRDQVTKAAALAKDLRDIQARLQILAERAAEFLKGDRSHRADGILRQVTETALRLASLRVQLATPPSDPYLRRLRAALESRWGADRLLPELQAQAADVEKAVQSVDHARNQKRLTQIALLATPVVVMVTAVEPFGKYAATLFGITPETSGPLTWLALLVAGIAMAWTLTTPWRGKGPTDKD